MLYLESFIKASGTVLQDEKLGRTRAQTRKLSTSSDEKPGMKRTGTMAATAKVITLNTSPF